MKEVSFVLSVFFFLNSVSLDAQVYDQFFQKQDVSLKLYVASLYTKVVQQRSKIEDQSIIEIYDRGSGKFLGFKVNDEKFDFALVPYLQSEDVMFLVKEFAPGISVAIFQEEILPGMTEEEAVLSWGDPNRIDDEGDQRIIRYDRGVVYLEDGKVTSYELFYD